MAYKQIKPDDMEEEDMPPMPATADMAPEAPEEGDMEEEIDEAPEMEEEPGNVKISEVFQKEVSSMIMGATKPEIEFIRSELAEREKSLNKSQSEAGMAAEAFSTEGLPE
tara:strand:+ start:941 stop:1270 length:330 start_codon:yes stop_codon:yes gene_type:complete